MTAPDTLWLCDAGEVLGTMPVLGKLWELAQYDPTYTNLINLGVRLRIEGRPEEALEVLSRAYFLDKLRPEACHNIGICNTDLGRFPQALDSFQVAWFHSKELGESHRKAIASGLAYSLMRLGRFEEAWPHWEFGRLNCSWRPMLGTEVWDGSPGKKVVVIPEGGYGDAFLFRRWLPLLKARCSHVRLVLWEALVDWCDWSALGVDEVVPVKPGFGPAFDITNFDPEEVSISWMSLPGIFGMKSWSDVDRDYIGRKTKIDPPHNPHIGFCWQAEENGSLRRVRSLSESEANVIMHCLNFIGRPYSLVPQRKELHQSGAPCFQPTGIIQREDSMRSWRSTTAYLAAMDLVVTVDTACLHLCGLLGVPTLALIPLCADWKWTTGQHLYGPHVRLFRNTKLEWEVDRICQAIKEMVS